MRVNEVVKMGVVQEVAEVANLRIGKKVIMFDNRKLCDLMVFSITSSRAYQYSPIAGPKSSGISKHLLQSNSTHSIESPLPISTPPPSPPRGPHSNTYLPIPTPLSQQFPRIKKCTPRDDPY